MVIIKCFIKMLLKISVSISSAWCLNLYSQLFRWSQGKIHQIPFAVESYSQICTYIYNSRSISSHLSHLSLILSRSLMRISETSFHREKNCKNWFTFVHVFFLVSSWLSIVLIDRLLLKSRHWLISLLLLYLKTLYM